MASIFTTALVSATADAVVAGGSKHWFIRGVAGTTAAARSTVDDWVAGPVRVGWTITPSPSKTEVTLEDGTKKVTKKEIAYELAIKTAQIDGGTLYGFQKAAYNNGYFQFLMESVPNAVLPGTKRQYVSCIGEMTDPNAAGSQGETEYKFALSAATANCAIDLATGYTASAVFPNFGSVTGTITLISGQFYIVTDTA